MFTLDYEDWFNICSDVLSQNNERKKMYLQWYPFSFLKDEEKELLLDEHFFNKFIKSGLFLYYPENQIITDNYIMRSDGNFRNSSLVSPLLYLLVLTLGKSLAKAFMSQRDQLINVFYAGNYEENRIYYKKDYDAFFKTVNNLSSSYKYFIKTDIKDFFSNIDVNKLFQILSHRFDEIDAQVSQKDLLIYKELLLCLGQGEFPLIENSVASSYLATFVYLEKPDAKLFSYLTEKEKKIKDFAMVRYVDDLYILFNTDLTENVITPMANRVLWEYSSELKKLNLSLNREKTTWKPTTRISEELQKSLYDEDVYRKVSNITDLVDSQLLLNFLKDIKKAQLDYTLDSFKYKELIIKNFYISNVEFTPQEIYNSFVYENHDLFQQDKIVNILDFLVVDDYNFLKLDTKRLTIMLLKTKKESIIKTLLSKLFHANRKGIWSIYDAALAINYLLQRGFVHSDLLKILKTEEKSLYSYYEFFCKLPFLTKIEKSKHKYICSFYDNLFYKKDNKLFFLYFMYLAEIKKGNYLAAFAYFKNFFDRISAHLAFTINGEKANKKPKYKSYYKEKDLKIFYKEIDGADIVIAQAHKIRNSNPLTHSEADLVDANNTVEMILENIEQLSKVLEGKIEVYMKSSNGSSDA